MGTLFRERLCRGDMARRLPEPPDGSRQRCMLSEAELRAVEDAAHATRLSVAAWIRVALIDSAAHTDRVPAWAAIADKLIAEGSSEKRRPGRPKKGSDDGGGESPKKKPK